MSGRPFAAAALFAALALLPAAPALAVNEIVITHAKALAGNVTPGDTAGYPVKLTVSGSYILGSNLTVPVGNTGIQIFADNVTIDLSGYQLFGNAKSAWYGIVGAGGRDGGTIKNGTISDFLYDGINGAGDYWVIENMRVVGNGRDGVVVPSNYNLVRNNIISVNARHGINCYFFCQVEGNMVSDNGSIGVGILSGTVLGNTIMSNTYAGIWATIQNHVGFGNNTLIDNGPPQMSGAIPLQPNHCNPAC